MKVWSDMSLGGSRGDVGVRGAVGLGGGADGPGLQESVPVYVGD